MSCATAAALSVPLDEALFPTAPILSVGVPPPHQSSSRLYSRSRLSNTEHTCRREVAQSQRSYNNEFHEEAGINTQVFMSPLSDFVPTYASTIKRIYCCIFDNYKTMKSNIIFFFFIEILDNPELYYN
jgi:hypothetical protein